MADYVTRWINDSIGMEARLTVLGHVQRGGSPTVYDRIMAYKFSVAAIESLISGQENAIMVHRKGTFGSLPISEVCDSKFEMDPSILKLCRPLCG
jgi:6-phosphofructokinase 1